MHDDLQVRFIPNLVPCWYSQRLFELTPNIPTDQTASYAMIIAFEHQPQQPLSLPIERLSISSWRLYVTDAINFDNPATFVR
jgi:hypothetical protein